MESRKMFGGEEGLQQRFNSMTLPENYLDAAGIINSFPEYYLPQNPLPPAPGNHTYWDPTLLQNANSNFDHLPFPSTNNNLIANTNEFSTLGFAASADHNQTLHPVDYFASVYQLAGSLNRLRLSNNDGSFGLESNQSVPNSFMQSMLCNDRLSIQEHEYISAMLVQYRLDQFMRLSNLSSGNLSRSSSSNRSSTALISRGQLGFNRIRNHNRYERGMNSMVKNQRIGNHNRHAAEKDVPSYNSVSLESLRGKIAVVAKDDVWCRFLKRKIDEGVVEEIDMIFKEIMKDDHNHFYELMVDQFGTEVIQKLAERTNYREGCIEMLNLVMSDEGKLQDICTDQRGSRAMQKLLERVENPEQQSSFMRVLKRIAFPLIKTQPGFYVINVCLEKFSHDSIKCVLDLLLDNSQALAKDSFGCRLLQNCIDGYPACNEAEKERLVADIIEDALILSEDRFGNYVVQHMLVSRPRVTAELLGQLQGYLVILSMNQFASNVVEKILKVSGEEHANMVTNELINKSPEFLNICQDQYGNFVAQTAIDASKGAVHSDLMDCILSNSSHLHSNVHGKWVLDKARRCRCRLCSFRIRSRMA